MFGLPGGDAFGGDMLCGGDEAGALGGVAGPPGGVGFGG